MTKSETKKLDYLILANLVNSAETESDIVDMVQRFIIMRFSTELNFNIQNPRPVGDETDINKE